MSEELVWGVKNGDIDAVKKEIENKKVIVNCKCHLLKIIVKLKFRHLPFCGWGTEILLTVRPSLLS
jgi:hypothetical protein